MSEQIKKALKASHPKGPFPTKDKDLVLALSGAYQMMTGVSYIRIQEEKIILTYTDNSTEQRDVQEYSSPTATIFDLVRYVQNGRKTA